MIPPIALKRKPAAVIASTVVHVGCAVWAACVAALLTAAHLCKTLDNLRWCRWKRRWFVLDGYNLLYYRSSSDYPAQPPRGTIPLRGSELYTAVHARYGNRYLEVHDPTGKVKYPLVAESAEEYNQWLDTLVYVINLGEDEDEELMAEEGDANDDEHDGTAGGNDKSDGAGGRPSSTAPDGQQRPGASAGVTRQQQYHDGGGSGARLQNQQQHHASLMTKLHHSAQPSSDSDHAEPRQPSFADDDVAARIASSRLTRDVEEVQLTDRAEEAAIAASLPDMPSRHAASQILSLVAAAVASAAVGESTRMGVEDILSSWTLDDNAEWLANHMASVAAGLAAQSNVPTDPSTGLSPRHASSSLAQLLNINLNQPVPAPVAVPVSVAISGAAAADSVAAGSSPGDVRVVTGDDQSSDAPSAAASASTASPVDPVAAFTGLSDRDDAEAAGAVGNGGAGDDAAVTAATPSGKPSAAALSPTALLLAKEAAKTRLLIAVTSHVAAAAEQEAATVRLAISRSHSRLRQAAVESSAHMAHHMGSTMAASQWIAKYRPQSAHSRSSSTERRRRDASAGPPAQATPHRRRGSSASGSRLASPTASSQAKAVVLRGRGQQRPAAAGNVPAMVLPPSDEMPAVPSSTSTAFPSSMATLAADHTDASAADEVRMMMAMQQKQRVSEGEGGSNVSAVAVSRSRAASPGPVHLVRRTGKAAAASTSTSPVRHHRRGGEGSSDTPRSTSASSSSESTTAAHDHDHHTQHGNRVGKLPRVALLGQSQAAAAAAAHRAQAQSSTSSRRPSSVASRVEDHNAASSALPQPLGHISSPGAMASPRHTKTSAARVDAAQRERRLAWDAEQVLVATALSSPSRVGGADHRHVHLTSPGRSSGVSSPMSASPSGSHYHHATAATASVSMVMRTIHLQYSHPDFPAALEDCDDVLRQVFDQYCGVDSNASGASMSLQQLQRLCSDAGIVDTHSSSSSSIGTSSYHSHNPFDLTQQHVAEVFDRLVSRSGSTTTASIAFPQFVSVMLVLALILHGSNDSSGPAGACPLREVVQTTLEPHVKAVSAAAKLTGPAEALQVVGSAAETSPIASPRVNALVDRMHQLGIEVPALPPATATGNRSDARDRRDRDTIVTGPLHMADLSATARSTQHAPAFPSVFTSAQPHSELHSSSSSPDISLTATIDVAAPRRAAPLSSSTAYGGGALPSGTAVNQGYYLVSGGVAAHHRDEQLHVLQGQQQGASPGRVVRDAGSVTSSSPLHVPGLRDEHNHKMSLSTTQHTPSRTHSPRMHDVSTANDVPVSRRFSEAASTDGGGVTHASPQTTPTRPSAAAVAQSDLDDARSIVSSPSLSTAGSPSQLHQSGHRQLHHQQHGRRASLGTLAGPGTALQDSSVGLSSLLPAPLLKRLSPSTGRATDIPDVKQVLSMDRKALDVLFRHYSHVRASNVPTAAGRGGKTHLHGMMKAFGLAPASTANAKRSAAAASSAGGASSPSAGGGPGRGYPTSDTGLAIPSTVLLDTSLLLFSDVSRCAHEFNLVPALVTHAALYQLFTGVAEHLEQPDAPGHSQHHLNSPAKGLEASSSSAATAAAVTPAATSGGGGGGVLVVRVPAFLELLARVSLVAYHISGPLLSPGASLLVLLRWMDMSDGRQAIMKSSYKGAGGIRFAARTAF